MKIDVTSSVQQSVMQAIELGTWNRYQGSSIDDLESQLAKLTGNSHVQLTSSGTAALEILLRAAGIGAGCEVLLSSYDYPGNFWAIERVGARPSLVDVDSNHWHIGIESLDNAFQPSCKALIASHLHGALQPMIELRAWCDSRNVLLIEDACQAIGAKMLDQMIGTFGHAAIFSFGGGKLISCGRGGAWATPDESLAIRARVASGAGSGPYLMSELQAAAVCGQMPWLDQLNTECRAFFAQLDVELKARSCDWHFVAKQHLESTSFYQCGWLLPEDFTSQSRQNLITALNSDRALEDSTRPLFGTGFSGFHRRSGRRCRIAGILTNSISASERTFVLHHRVALDQQWTPSQLAEWIVACDTQSR